MTIHFSDLTIANSTGALEINDPFILWMDILFRIWIGTKFRRWYWRLAACTMSFTSLIRRLICWLVRSSSFSCFCRLSRNCGLSVKHSVNSSGCRPTPMVHWYLPHKRCAQTHSLSPIHFNNIHHFEVLTDAGRIQNLTLLSITLIFILNWIKNYEKCPRTIFISRFIVA